MKLLDFHEYSKRFDLESLLGQQKNCNHLFQYTDNGIEKNLMKAWC